MKMLIYVALNLFCLPCLAQPTPTLGFPPGPRDPVIREAISRLRQGLPLITNNQNDAPRPSPVYQKDIPRIDENIKQDTNQGKNP